MVETGMRAEIMEFYSENYNEDARLRDQPHGRLEFLRTQELLRRHLPSTPARVLDVGGGSGVHAEWLAAEGYQVHLIDPVARHRELAASIGTFTVADGDARVLSAADESYNAMLLLGPLYHLVERADRIRALAEARRVVRPGGLVAAAVISRHAPVVDQAVVSKITAENEADFVRELATGRHDPAGGFTTSYFHTVADIESELAESGLDQTGLYGIEGPAWATVLYLGKAGLPVPDQLLDSALRAARLVEDDRALIAFSSHLLATAVRNSSG